MSEVDFELLERVMREARDESRATRSELGTKIDKLSFEIGEGFAIMRNHAYAQHAEMQHMERRISALEAEVDRLNHAQGINADS